ncbi:MAG: HAD-IA family hydrolase [Gammaproteobacteria bacterium]|nr:HAD-IA family hydrolase [Gammaproteobacteria bacterium]
MSDAAKRPGTAIRLVLFDLDGTFADTAPDMAYALNRTLQQNGRQPLTLETIRPHVSHGGVALIRLGFGIEPDDPQFAPLRQQFLDFYRDNLTRGTSLFAGIDELLTRLEQLGIGWGIVTNKPGWLTDPLMRQLALDARAACIVSGDTTANAKPHPEPILHACRLHGTAPGDTLYIGDAERDIIAGKAAGTTTLVALFGYIGTGDRPDTWRADGAISAPLQVLDWLG